MDSFFRSNGSVIVPQPPSPDTCPVCGDKSTVVLQGVQSCGGCGVFFRRHKRSDEKLLCKLGGQCPITKETRKTCKACRFDKCLKAGMRRDSQNLDACNSQGIGSYYYPSPCHQTVDQSPTVPQGMTTVPQDPRIGCTSYPPMTTVPHGMATVPHGMATLHQGTTTVPHGMMTTVPPATVPQKMNTVPHGWMATVPHGMTTVPQEMVTVSQGMTTVATVPYGMATVTQDDRIGCTLYPPMTTVTHGMVATVPQGMATAPLATVPQEMATVPQGITTVTQDDRIGCTSYMPTGMATVPPPTVLQTTVPQDGFNPYYFAPPPDQSLNYPPLQITPTITQLIQGHMESCGHTCDKLNKLAPTPYSMIELSSDIYLNCLNTWQAFSYEIEQDIHETMRFANQCTRLGELDEEDRNLIFKKNYFLIFILKWSRGFSDFGLLLHDGRFLDRSTLHILYGAPLTQRILNFARQVTILTDTEIAPFVAFTLFTADKPEELRSHVQFVEIRNFYRRALFENMDFYVRRDTIPSLITEMNEIKKIHYKKLGFIGDHAYLLKLPPLFVDVFNIEPQRKEIQQTWIPTWIDQDF